MCDFNNEFKLMKEDRGVSVLQMPCAWTDDLIRNIASHVSPLHLDKLLELANAKTADNKIDQIITLISFILKTRYTKVDKKKFDDEFYNWEKSQLEPIEVPGETVKDQKDYVFDNSFTEKALSPPPDSRLINNHIYMMDQKAPEDCPVTFKGMTMEVSPYQSTDGFYVAHWDFKHTFTIDQKDYIFSTLMGHSTNIASVMTEIYNDMSGFKYRYIGKRVGEGIPLDQQAKQLLVPCTSDK